jgi:hypothetical protein
MDFNRPSPKKSVVGVGRQMVGRQLHISMQFNSRYRGIVIELSVWVVYMIDSMCCSILGVPHSRVRGVTARGGFGLNSAHIK